MSETKIMSADYARQITESNQIRTEGIIEMIESMAKAGGSCLIVNNLHNNAMQDLIRAGYKISMFRDTMGMDVTKIEW